LRGIVDRMTCNGQPRGNVCFWHLADVLLTSLHVRFRGQSRHI
jgi:hypothetical protein